MRTETLFRLAIHSVCTIFALQIPNRELLVASVVQWIERGFPKPKIWVRFPAEVQYYPIKLDNT